jgi:hypothetical protein
VSSNIVEGCSRSSRPELHSYIERAVGSLNELENHLNTVASAGAMRLEAHRAIVADIGMARGMLISFSRTVLRRIAEDEQAERKARERKRKKNAQPNLNAVDGSNGGADVL